MSSAPSDSTRRKVLALRADRLQKEIDLIKIQEDLASFDEDSLIADTSPSPFPTSSNPSSSFGSFSSLDESQMLSDKLIGSGVTKQLAESKLKFYEVDLQKAKSSNAPDKESWMAATKAKIIKHRDSAAYEASVMADCIKRLGSLSAPSNNPATAADQSFFTPIGHKPVYDGHSG